MGYGVGFSFMTSPMTVYTATSALTSLIFVEGSSNICDASGDILFSTHGQHIYNKNNSVMLNGLNVYPNITSTSQSALIVKQPQSTNLYYVFSLHSQAQFNSLRYSIVDMNLAAGLGSVTVKGATLTPSFYSSEKLTGVKHCNGTDVWVVTRSWDSGQFYSYLLTPSGLNATPVISQVAPDTILEQGYMKISPNGKKIAYVGKQQGLYNFSYDAVIIHDFDASNGTVSTNSMVLNGINFINKAYGIEFSPDASKLYLSCGANSFNSNCLYQWDLCSGNDQTINSSRFLLDSSLTDKPGCALQLGPDGKIYQSKDMATSISVINSPNNSSAACGYSANMIAIPSSTAMTRAGLPNYVVSYFQQPHPLFEYTLHCQTAQFAAYSNTLINTCSATNQSLQGISWDFGDPSSGVANVSSLQNPTHVFSALGTYTVNAIFQYQCRTDTLIRVINVVHSTPSYSISGRAAICKGESTVLSANTNSLSYFWFYPLPGGTTATSISVNPQSTTVYSVTGTYGSCSMSKAITVTVSACTGLSDLNTEHAQVILYPNPVDNVLHLQTNENFDPLETLSLTLFDLQGRLLFNRKIVAVSPNNYELDLAEHNLAKGMYRLEIRSESTHQNLFKKVVLMQR